MQRFRPLFLRKKGRKFSVLTVPKNRGKIFQYR
nr:MAG TPA: hypothetical protein [Caudoviricetes sp.]